MTHISEHHWVFGGRHHVHFPSAGNPVAAAPSQIMTTEGVACISDAQGNLVMYTDGRTVWDANNVQITTGLSGASTSTHSALIIPPTAPYTDYHLFTVSHDSDATRDPIWHSTYRQSGTTVTQILPPTEISASIAGNFDSTERLAAVSDADCTGFFVVFQQEHVNVFSLLHVTTDARPQLAGQSTVPMDTGGIEVGYMKFSPDGKLLAYCDYYSKFVSVLDFDPSSAALTERHRIVDIPGPYGLEFSPDSQSLFITSLQSNELRHHTLSAGGQTFGACQLLHSGEMVCALQLAPNGSIYGKRLFQPGLLEIQTPSTPQVVANALYADGTPMLANGPIGHAGLPSFARHSDTCASVSGQPDLCAAISADVNDQITSAAKDYENGLPTCDGQSAVAPGVAACTPLDIPSINPTFHVTWGQSECDGMESDDVEVMSLTICNPYSNISLSGLMVHKIEVVNPDGTPVDVLPGGDPSVTLVPLGPYCFGDLGPCSCISREFTVRTRGAKPGDYELRLSGVCYDVCIHQDTRACFKLHVCKD